MGMTATPERQPFPPDGACPICGHDDKWKLTETGYVRFTSIEFERDEENEEGDDGEIVGIHATTGGWDDMSETGDDEFMTCFGCLSEYLMPDIEVEWD